MYYSGRCGLGWEDMRTKAFVADMLPSLRGQAFCQILPDISEFIELRTTWIYLWPEANYLVGYLQD